MARLDRISNGIFNLFADAQTGPDAPGNQVLVYGLWIGVGLLFLLSLILVWTRWGQAKPLSKCIALSLFAHILLGGYAYGTRLIFNYSSAVADPDPVAFSVVDEDWEEPIEEQEQLEDRDSNSNSEKPWEKFADSESVPEGIDHQKLVHHEAPVPRRETFEPEIEHQDHELTKDVGREIQPPSAPSIDTPPKSTVEIAQEKQVDPAQIAEAKAPEKREIPLEKPAPVAPVIDKVVNHQPSELQAPKPQVEPKQIDTSPIKKELDNQVSRPTAEMLADSHDLKDANSVPSVARASKFRQVSHPKGQYSRPESNPPVARRLADGQPVPKLYQNRFANNRLQLVQKSGGTLESQKSVELALQWLSKEQSEDGRWNPRRFNAGNESNVYGHNRGGAGFNADTGITGLVILSFLGAGHTHFEGPYQKNVQKGLEYLIRTQNQDGSLYGNAGLFARTYCHGMALMAISEAYAMTGDHRIKPFIEKAQKYTVETQNQTTGGWRYRPGDDGDMSQFGWQVMALKSAEMAGVPIPQNTRRLMIRFLRNYEKGKSGGLAAYRPAERPSRTMTAEALFCRRLLGVDVDPAASAEAVAFVIEELPGRTRVDNLYFWYYATLCLHEEKSRFKFQENQWKKWNQALTRKIVSLQTQGSNQEEKNLTGSFSNETLWSTYGGKFYSTAMSTLCLEVYYRYQSGQKSPAPSRTAWRKR